MAQNNNNKRKLVDILQGTLSEASKKKVQQLWGNHSHEGNQEKDASKALAWISVKLDDIRLTHGHKSQQQRKELKWLQDKLQKIRTLSKYEQDIIWHEILFVELDEKKTAIKARFGLECSDE